MLKSGSPISAVLGALALVVLASGSGGAAEETPALTVGGVTAEGLVVSTTSVSFTRSIPIINTQKAAVELTIDISGLVGPDSASVDTRWDLNGETSSPLTAKIPPLGSAQLTMTTALPVLGAYQATLSLIYGDRRHPIPIKITRAATTLGVAVTGLSAMAFEGWRARAVDFSLKETAGARISLHSPRVLSLTRKVGDKILQAEISGVTFHTVGPDGKEMPITTGLAIDGNASIPIVMRVSGAADPGEYTGSLHIASPEGALAAMPFTFYVRRSWLVCAVLIALGVVLSHFLRNYVKSGRPRLILARRFALLDADINTVADGLPDPDDRSLLAALKERVQRAASDADVGQATDVDATLKDINAKLSVVPLWSTLRRRIAGVTPSEDADAARPVLVDARRFLTAHQNDTADQIGREIQSIRDALTKIGTAIRKRLTGEIEKTRASAETAAADLSPEREPKFKREVLEVLKGAVSATELTPPDDAGARKRIDEARRAYAGIVALELEEKLDAVERPAAISEGDWNALVFAFKKHVENIEAAATGNEAVAEYERAYAQYLEILVRVATEALNAVRLRVNEVDQTEWHRRLDNAAKALNLARTRLRQRDQDAARTSYQEAKAEIDAAVKEFPAAKIKTMDETGRAVRQPLGLRSAATHVVLGLSDVPSLDAPAERRVREWPSLADIDHSLMRRDRFVSWTTGAVAVLFGLYLIWMDNLTWGSPKDMAAAVFWGLGLHQVAGNTLFAKLELEQFENHLTGRKVEQSGATT